MDRESREVRWRVESFLLASYGEFSGLDYLRSHNNHVYRAKYPAGRSLIVKIPGPGTSIEAFRKEIELIKHLADGPLPVPAVNLDSQTDLVVLEDIPGMTLEDYAHRFGPDSSPAWRSTGRLAARFCKVSLEHVARWIQPQWNGFDALRDRLAQSGLWNPPFPAILDEARRIWFTNAPVFIHADFGPGQVLVDGNDCRDLHIIDWENASVGSLLDPLARCIALTREYLRCEDYISWLVEGFEDLHPLKPEEQRELHLREMISHLRDISWKLGWQPDHHRHALGYALRVAEWHTAVS